MKFKKVIILTLTVFMLFSACACKGNLSGGEEPIDDTQTQTSYTVNLLHCANDTYNPYTLTTKINAEICQLLYDPLYTVNNSFEPIAVLASESAKEGNSWKITLKDVYFTDGSILTADDVIYSFNLAKNCTRYSTQLSKVDSVEKNGKQVVFNLSVNDDYFINVLTFPVLKVDSDKRYNEDNVLLVPIGTGRFILSDDKSCLEINENYFGAKSNVKKVLLKNAPDSESVAHYVEVGATDFYYADTSEGSIMRMTGKKATANRNVLVYLGINDNTASLSNINMRYAISAALSREKIVSSAFYGNAVAATGPFHPDWEAVKGSQNTPSLAKKEIAIENLNKIGYNVLNTQGYFINSNGQELAFSLLVNSESSVKVATAQLIATQLKEAGIKINITSLPYDRYIEALNQGSFQLYLGEVKIDNNFDISPLVVPGGSCAFGKTEADSTVAVSAQSVVKDYLSGKATIANVVTALQSEMPFIPLCYRSGIMFYSENIKDDFDFFENDLFYSFDRLIINN